MALLAEQLLPTPEGRRFESDRPSVLWEIHREVIKRREKIGTGNFRVQPVANACLYQNTLVILINLRLNKHFNTI